MLVVTLDKGQCTTTERVYYFGRRPSAQDFIKHNCKGQSIELYERSQEGAYQPIYEAEIDENGKAVRYSGKEIHRKEGAA